MSYLRSDASKARDDLVFKVQHGINYHLRRERHFARWGKFFNFCVILFGAAAMADFLGRSFEAWRAVGGVAIATLGALNLVINFGAEQFRHNDLRRNYQQILSDLVTIPYNSEPELNSIQRRILELERSEPAVLMVVSYLAYNDALRQAGHRDAARFRIGILQRAFSGWADLWPESIEMPKELEEIVARV